MNATQKLGNRIEVQQRAEGGVIEPGDFRLYVHLCNGDIVEVDAVTRVGLDTRDVLLLLGDIVVARFPRQDVLFVAREKVAPPAIC
jgi:hypothetical protein